MGVLKSQFIGISGNYWTLQLHPPAVSCQTLPFCEARVIHACLCGLLAHSLALSEPIDGSKTLLKKHFDIMDKYEATIFLGILIISWGCDIAFQVSQQCYIRS